jgi:hypothetical protein
MNKIRKSLLVEKHGNPLNAGTHRKTIHNNNKEHDSYMLLIFFDGVNMDTGG